MAATALPPFDRMRRRWLAGFLAGASGAREVEVTGLAPAARAARSRRIGRVDADFSGGRLAGRAAPRLAHRRGDRQSRRASVALEEFAVLKAAFAAGVTVPEPLFACADPEVIGKPFFVMRRVAGTAQGRQITRDPALEPAFAGDRRAARRANWRGSRRSGRRAPDLAFLPPYRERPAQQIAGFRAYLDRHPNAAAGARMGDTLARNPYPAAAAAGAVPPRFPHRQLHAGRRRADRDPRLGIRRLGRSATRISAGSAARAGASRGSTARPAASPTARRSTAATRPRRAGRLDPRAGAVSGRCWRMSAGRSSRCSRATAT